jgi:quinol monooxygenase YgiN
MPKNASSTRVSAGDQRVSLGLAGSLIPTRQGVIMETPYAFVARLEAKPDKVEALASLLAGALPLAQAETGTVDWYTARTSATTFWIFDTFGSEDARQAHINGPIAAALMANADELLAAPPEILPADVLAAK